METLFLSAHFASRCLTVLRLSAHFVSHCFELGCRSRRDLLEGSVARNSAHLGSARAKNGQAFHIQTWGENCVSQHWKFVCYITSPPHERWVRGMLQWQLFGRGSVGRPAMHWASNFEQFSRIKHWYDWKDVAANAKQWMVDRVDFGKFCTK